MNSFLIEKKRGPLLLCLFSAIFLTLAFPKFDFYLSAWIGLIPLMFLLDGKKAGAAFRFGYLTGVLFFLGTMFWIRHVTIFGAVILSLYLALYFGLFGWGYWFFWI